MENKIRILIAEDESEFCGNSLSASGFEVFYTGKDGRELLDNIVLRKPDVVISCAFMPQMDLISVISSIKDKSHRTPRLLIIQKYISLYH